MAAAVDFIATQAMIDKGRIGLIGHSEGGIVAPMVANKSEEVDFMILLAGPVLPGDQNLLLQKNESKKRGG